jgi:SPOR domain
MRVTFLLLLAANLALLAWFQQFSPSDSAADPEPARRQVNPEKMRVLQDREPAGFAAAAPKPGAKPAPPPVVAQGAPAPAATTPAAPGACSEWGGFAIAEAPKAEQALAPLALGARLVQRRSDETAGWWVFIPPQGNRATALKKTAELKALGIDDYFILQDEGKMRWAVSLGIFSTEEAARNRLEALRAKGVRSAQTGERDTAVSKIWFQVRGADAALLARLRESAQGFPGTEVRDCP